MARRAENLGTRRISVVLDGDGLVEAVVTGGAVVGAVVGADSSVSVQPASTRRPAASATPYGFITRL